MSKNEKYPLWFPGLAVKAFVANVTTMTTVNDTYYFTSTAQVVLSHRDHA